MSVKLLIAFPEGCDRISLFRDVDEIREEFDINISSYCRNHDPPKNSPDYTINFSGEDPTSLVTRLTQYNPKISVTTK